MMNLFSFLACCGQRGKPNFEQRSLDFTQIDQEVALKYLDNFEHETIVVHLFKVVPLRDLLQHIRLLAWSYDDTISSRQLSLAYQKLGFQFTSLIIVFA